MGVTTGVEAPNERAEAEARRGWERPLVKLIAWVATSLFCILVWIEFGRVVVAMIQSHF